MTKLKKEIKTDFIFLQVIFQAILLIVCYDNFDYKLSLGFVVGGFLSYINFYFICKGLENVRTDGSENNFKTIFSSYLFRYVFLVGLVFLLVSISVVRLETFLPALFSLQIILFYREFIGNKLA